MTLWAENNEGLHNLFRLSSLASIEGYYRKPRFDRDLLDRYGKGLIGTTGCPSGEVNRWLQAGQYDKALAAAADFQDILGKDNYFCELMDHGIDIERRFRDDLLRIAKHPRPAAPRHQRPALRPPRATPKMHDAFLCVGTEEPWTTPSGSGSTSHDFYIKSAARDARTCGATCPEACDNTLLIAERCDVSFNEGAEPHAPLPGPGGRDRGVVAGQGGRARPRAGASPDRVPDEHRKQAEYEVGVIAQMGFPGYFLVVADLVRHAKEHGIRVGPGRGSAAGAIIAWALGITELDPLAHGLLFERFLNPERISMPDIDIDFDERRRGEMIRYATEKYGEDHVAQIITYGTIKAKAAIKDAARVLGHPFALGDRITKAMPPAVMGKDIPLARHLRPRARPLRRGRRVPGPVRGRRRRPQGRRHRAKGSRASSARSASTPRASILCREPLLDVIPVGDATRTARSSRSSTWAPARRSACSRWTSWACATSR